MASAKAAVARYIEQGFRPVPVFGVDRGRCQCGRVDSIEHGKARQGIGKHPVEPDRWRDRLYVPRDFDEGNNIALAMGRQRDGRWLVALDLDGNVPLEEWLRVRLPPTLTARTGRGTHLIYEVEPYAPLGNWRDAWRTRDPEHGYRRGYNGALDIRYARGAIVAPPSTHRTGTRYQWANDLQPAKLPLEAVRKLLKKRVVLGLPVRRRWEGGTP